MTATIISVSGPPGAGKSTLVASLAEATGGAVVSYDDFEIITRWHPERVIAWLDAGAPMEKIIAPGLYDSLVSQTGLVFLETPFGRACPATGGMIAASIWLECADDIALARKLSALAQMNAGNKGFADFVFGWLQAYETFTRRALAVQRHRVKPTADYCIQAEVESAEVLSSSILALKAHI